MSLAMHAAIGAASVFGAQTASRVSVRSRRGPQTARATESRENSHASASSRRRVQRPLRSRGRVSGDHSSRTRLAAYTSTEADPSAVDPGPDGDWSHVDADFLYDSIRDKLGYLTDYERSEVKDATRMAFNAHDGQKRKSGEPFVTHPVAVAGEVHKGRRVAVLRPSCCRMGTARQRSLFTTMTSR